jgi:hypothetical protein
LETALSVARQCTGPFKVVHSSNKSHDRTPIPGFAEKAKRDMRSFGSPRRVTFDEHSDHTLIYDTFLLSFHHLRYSPLVQLRRGATPHGLLAARAFNFLRVRPLRWTDLSKPPSPSCVASSPNPVFILLFAPLFDSAIRLPPAMHQNMFKLIPTIPYNSPSSSCFFPSRHVFFVLNS